MESLEGRRNTVLNGHTLQSALETPVGMMHPRMPSLKDRKMSTGVDSTNAISDSQHLQPMQTQQPNAQQSQFVRTRIRTSFDPELELPKLHKWFSENQHPSRGQIQLYVKELNSLESRRGRKPLDINNVVYWFKNARAAHKRQELKFVNGSNSGNGNGNESDNNNDCEGRNLNRGEESSPNGKHNLDYEDESGDDRTEDDNSSQFSQTLDLSNKRRRRSDSLDSENHNPSVPVIGSDMMNNLKEEAMTDDEEDDDGRDSAENGMSFDKFYGPAHGLPGSAGLSYYASSNGSPGSTGNVLMNGQSGLSYGGLYPPHSSHSNNKIPSGNNGNNSINNPESPDNESRRIRRSRTFIDPMTEVPRLEQWFSVNTHPTHSQIVRYTDELNRLQYRMKFPKLEPKNIQFWFKNRRAKFKRLSLPSLTPSSSTHPSLGSLSHHHNCNNNNNNIPSSPTTSSSHGPNNVNNNNASPVTSSSPSSSLNSSPKSQGNLSSSLISSSNPQSGLPAVTSALNIERLISNWVNV